MGPESRIQPRSVGTRKQSTASRLAPDFFRMVRTRDSASRFSTSRNTRSTCDKWRTISAKAHGMGANFPGQSVSSCGQPSQVASWRSHSAGMRKPRACGVLMDGSVFIGRKNLTQRSQRAQRTQRRHRTKRVRNDRGAEKSALLFVQPAVQYGWIGVDAAVAQKRPVAASFFALCGVAFNHQNFFLIVGCLGNNLAEGVSDKGISPEFQSRVSLFRLAFESYAIHHGSVHTVGNGMSALNRFPGVELCGAELRLLVRVPADAGGIENHL